MDIHIPAGAALGDRLTFQYDGTTYDFTFLGTKVYTFFVSTASDVKSIVADFKLANSPRDVIRFKMAGNEQYKRCRMIDVLKVDNTGASFSSKRIKIKLQGTMQNCSEEDYWQCPPKEYETASARAQMWSWQD